MKSRMMVCVTDSWMLCQPSDVAVHANTYSPYIIAAGTFAGSDAVSLTLSSCVFHMLIDGALMGGGYASGVGKHT